MTDNAEIDAALERAIDLGEVGVQVAAYLDGELIVDRWIGVADERNGAPVAERTLFPVFSVSKGFISTAVHLQAERGLLDVEAPIAQYWPEYAANGKGGITIRHVMEHTAGVPHMPPDLRPDGMHDWKGIVGWLAQVTPISPPGERSTYHALSLGYILGEVVRRTDPRARLFSDYLRQELCAPLGLEDLWVGLPAELEDRVAHLTLGVQAESAPATAQPPMRALAMPRALVSSPAPYNDPAEHQACNPAASGIMTARDCARFFAMLAGGGTLDGATLLSRDRLLAQTRYRAKPLVDEYMTMLCPLGVGGYWLSGTGMPTGTLSAPIFYDPVVDQGPHVLVSNGAGGSIAWANLDTGLAAAITHNRMFDGISVGRDRHPFVALGEAIRRVSGVPAAVGQRH